MSLSTSFDYNPAYQANNGLVVCWKLCFVILSNDENTHRANAPTANNKDIAWALVCNGVCSEGSAATWSDGLRTPLVNALHPNDWGWTLSLPQVTQGRTKLIRLGGSMNFTWCVMYCLKMNSLLCLIRVTLGKFIVSYVWVSGPKYFWLKLKIEKILKIIISIVVLKS